MDSIVLNVEARDTGKSAAKAARRAGNVPCVLYGADMEPVHFQVHELSLRPLIFTHETHTVEVNLDGEKWSCILRDIDFHPVSDRPLHADFLALQAGVAVKMTVPVQLLGTPAGALEGGVTNQIISEIEVECLPKDIPSVIEVEVSALNIGDTIHVASLELENVTILTSPDRTIVTISGAAPEEEEVVDTLEGIEGEEEAAAEGADSGEGESDGDDSQD